MVGQAVCDTSAGRTSLGRRRYYLHYPTSSFYECAVVPEAPDTATGAPWKASCSRCRACAGSVSQCMQSTMLRSWSFSVLSKAGVGESENPAPCPHSLPTTYEQLASTNLSVQHSLTERAFRTSLCIRDCTSSFLSFPLQEQHLYKLGKSLFPLSILALHCCYA